VKVVLADLEGTGGFVQKDTVVGGYGARLRPFSRVTRVVSALNRRLNRMPSVTLGYLAAIHEVAYSNGPPVDGDVALVLSSLVDHRNETKWAFAARSRGARVGFVGLAASKMPALFADAADFLIAGEPEEAVMRLARGEALTGLCASRDLGDLDALPFPRWDLLRAPKRARSLWSRPVRVFPVLASRSCPEFCTYCPHRILAPYRARSVGNIADELAQLCRRYGRPFVVFRDPLFTQDRARTLALCDAIRDRGLQLGFECETRLDRMDEELLERLARAGLRILKFGVESVAPDVLRKVGRRPIPEPRQRAVVQACHRLGVRTVGFYVLGLPADTWESIAATIDYSISLGSTLANFKMLTPYPGTPLWKHLGPRVRERDWERFDGFSVTFEHPALSASELRFLLASAYRRFYVRPTFLARYWTGAASLMPLAQRLDPRVAHLHSRKEAALMSRPVAC
jgi:radical SAM superfamily enzyme YgiQ (UPF0313 family)